MDKISIIEKTDDLTSVTTEHVFIEHEDGSFTSMFKSTWDEKQKQTPSFPVTDAETL